MYARRKSLAFEYEADVHYSDFLIFSSTDPPVLERHQQSWLLPVAFTATKTCARWFSS